MDEQPRGSVLKRIVFETMGKRGCGVIYDSRFGSESGMGLIVKSMNRRRFGVEVVVCFGDIYFDDEQLGCFSGLRNKGKCCIFVALDLDGHNLAELVGKMVLALEIRFANDDPRRRGFLYLDVPRNGPPRWESPVIRLRDLRRRRLQASQTEKRCRGKILKLGDSACRISDDNGTEYLASYASFSGHRDKARLAVGRSVSFFPTPRKVSSCPTAEYVLLESSDEEEPARLVG